MKSLYGGSFLAWVGTKFAIRCTQVKTYKDRFFKVFKPLARSLVWSLCLSLCALSQIFAPEAMAATRSSCRVWVDSSAENRIALIESFQAKGYTTLDYSKSAKVEHGDFLIFRASSRIPQNTFNVAFSDQRPSELGYLTENIKDFPNCSAHEQIMTEAYFRIYYGEMARRRLNTPTAIVHQLEGLGEMVLEVEALKQTGYSGFLPVAKRYKKVYANVLKQVRKRWEAGADLPFEKRIDRVRELLAPYTTNYFLYLNHLSLLLTKPHMGNCVSTTLLYTTVFKDAHIDLGKDHQFAVQMFQDHVQPVIWNMKTNQLVSLVSGTIQKWNGSIYDPEVMTWALANAAGRAMHSERELFLKKAWLNVRYIKPNLGVRYFLGFKDGGKPAGDLPYLKFDNSLSMFGDGAPPIFAKQNPMAFGTPDSDITGDKESEAEWAEIEKLLAESGLSNGENGQSLSEMGFRTVDELKRFIERLKLAQAEKDGTNAKEWKGGGGFAGEGADRRARAAAEPDIDKKIAILFNSRIWAAIPASQRPKLAEQVNISRQRFVLNSVGSGESERKFRSIRALPIVRAANPDELDEFTFDFPFLIKTAPTTTESISEFIDGNEVVFHGEVVELVFRDHANLQKAMDKKYQLSKIQQVVETELMQVHLELKGLSQPLDPLLTMIRNFKDRKENSEREHVTSAMETINKWSAFRKLNDQTNSELGFWGAINPTETSGALEAIGSCDLLVELSHLRKEALKNPKEFVLYLDKMLPQTAAMRIQQITNLVAAIHPAGFRPLVYCNNLDSEDRQGAKWPLLPILNHLIVLHEQDPHPIQRRPPQLIPVELVFGGEQSGKIVNRPSQMRPPQKGVANGSSGTETDPNDPNEEQNLNEKFNVRTDVLVNLIFAQPDFAMTNFAIQLKAFAWWNKDAQLSFEKYWASQPASEAKYIKLWQLPSVNLMRAVTPKDFIRALDVYDKGVPLAVLGEGYGENHKIRPEVLAYLQKRFKVQPVSFANLQIPHQEMSENELRNIRENLCNFADRTEIGPMAGRPILEMIKAPSWSIGSEILLSCPRNHTQKSLEPMSAHIGTWWTISGDTLDYEMQTLMLGTSAGINKDAKRLSRSQILKE